MCKKMDKINDEIIAELKKDISLLEQLMKLKNEEIKRLKYELSLCKEASPC